MNISKLKAFYQNRLVTKEVNTAVDEVLPAGTQNFLQTVGLPNNEELGFLFDERMSLLPGKLVRLEFVRPKPLCVDIAQGGIVCWSSASDDFVNSSISQFVECMYEFDVYYADIVSKQVFGKFRGETDGKPNRLAYAAYLEAKMKAVDSDIFAKGYYWPSFIERIADGGI